MSLEEQYEEVFRNFLSEDFGLQITDLEKQKIRSIMHNKLVSLESQVRDLSKSYQSRVDTRKRRLGKNILILTILNLWEKMISIIGFIMYIKWVN